MEGSARRGSMAAREQLIHRHRRLVVLIARRFFPHLSKDQDLLQCGLIGLWEATRTWSGSGEFTTYAGHSILNNMKDYLRLEKKAPPPTDVRGREPWVGYEDAVIDRLDTADRIHKAWPENSRERYVLLALSAGLSKHSIAAGLGVDLYTVRHIAARAMAGLERIPKD